MAVSEEVDIENKATIAVESTPDSATPPAYDGTALGQTNTLRRSLQGRHMQMIAIGQCSPGIRRGVYQ